jgi:hypothetical protein
VDVTTFSRSAAIWPNCSAPGWLASLPASLSSGCRTSRSYATPDLAAAREAWLAEAGEGTKERQRREKTDFLTYVNGAGEVADFHSLRHTYISTLVNSGVSVKVAQELARHSTPTLTIGRYAHARLHDIRGAIENLPAVAAGAAEKTALRATGTDNHTASCAQRQAQQLGHGNVRNGAEACEPAPSAGVLKIDARKQPKFSKMQKMRHLATICKALLECAESLPGGYPNG